MNIYINGRFLTQRVTGVQRYAIELIKRLDALLDSREEERSKHELTLLAPPKAIHELDLKHIRIREVGKIGGHAWEQLVLPRYARKGLLLNLCNTGPLFKNFQIATLHDAAVFERPNSYSFLFRNLYKLIQTSIGFRAQKVLTVSQFSKSQLIKHCGISPSKIEVIALGMEHIQELPTEVMELDSYPLSSNGFLLAVSSLNPSKNFATLARAIELLENVDYDIVIAGGSHGSVFRSEKLPHSQRIRFVGYVTDNQLKALYLEASCFLFPSLYEGFGLPPLEAMACGTPVIVSRTASLPEVCGEATLYCDPHDPKDIAAKIEEVMSNAALRRELSARGLERASMFSWDRCARQTWAIVKEVVQA